VNLIERLMMIWYGPKGAFADGRRCYRPILGDLPLAI
jgi:hypothetical protein